MRTACLPGGCSQIIESTAARLCFLNSVSGLSPGTRLLRRRGHRRRLIHFQNCHPLRLASGQKYDLSMEKLCFHFGRYINMRAKEATVEFFPALRMDPRWDIDLG